MPDGPTTPELFAEAYERKIGVVVENLWTLKQLVERDYLLSGPEADAYLKVCAMLLVTSCRMLGEALAPEFGSAAAPSSTDDLRERRTEPLFTETSRNLAPLERHALKGDRVLLRCPTEKALTHEQIQQIHDAAEDVLFHCGPEPGSTSEAAAALRDLREGHDHLADNLRQHLVDLSEWGILFVVEIDKFGDPRCSFVALPSLPEFV